MSFLFVKIYYGPCNTFHSCQHKPQLLNGVRERLMKMGFRLSIIPVNFINYCMIEMCGHEVFRCNIKHLKFNHSYAQDPVCQRAVEAVMTSAAKFRHARATLWFWSVLNHQMFRRTKYQPKDYWPVEIDWTELAPVKECIDCCKILVKYNNDAKEYSDEDDSTS
ncbi:UPF0728 protein v1g117062-like [Spodoptera litura]|uniref:UPF0728 protein v1g117062-like n=1 Tax=Spodoptera litura TaxID=69820 RepID=A0A9J7DUV3_SPOLT|nr:UPF0728 protein v1g117062-like [Spodoptera litura]